MTFNSLVFWKNASKEIFFEYLFSLSSSPYRPFHCCCCRQQLLLLLLLFLLRSVLLPTSKARASKQTSDHDDSATFQKLKEAPVSKKIVFVVGILLRIFKKYKFLVIENV